MTAKLKPTILHKHKKINKETGKKITVNTFTQTILNTPNQITRKE